MNWTQILTSILAGGLAGQLAPVLLGHTFIKKRDHLAWLRNERFKVFSELISCASASESREEYNDWADEFRVLSQKVHLLFDEGIAPDDTSIIMQCIFMLILDKKLNRIKDEKIWRKKLRDETRSLRKKLAKSLHS